MPECESLEGEDRRGKGSVPGGAECGVEGWGCFELTAVKKASTCVSPILGVEGGECAQHLRPGRRMAGGRECRIQIVPTAGEVTP